MSYQNYLSGFATLITGVVGSLIQAMAGLMDNPTFAIDRNNAYEMVPLRETAYERFCAACQMLGIPLPPLEQDVLNYYLPKQEKHNEDLIERNLKLAQEIRERTDNVLCRAMALMLETFPAVGSRSSDGVGRKNLLAVVNQELINLGQEPFRFLPGLCLPPESLGFNRELTVLVVDDKAEDIFRTALSLAGWPNIKLIWEHQTTKMPWEPSDEQKEQEVNRMVAAIVAHQPDIVLMDQGMRGIDGASLVPGVRQALPSAVVIANTGGSTDELHAAGAVGSANKGEKILQAMREVSWHFRG